MEDIQCLNQKQKILDKIYRNERLNSLSASFSYWTKNGIEPYYHYIHECTKHLDDETRWSERIFHFIHDLKELPKCTSCGNDVKLFYNVKRGYAKTCSRECSHKSVERGEKIRQTFSKKDSSEHARLIKSGIQEKYGVDNISKTEYFKEKYKEVMQEKYGVDNYFQLTDKVKEAVREKYGVDNPQQDKEIKEKTLATVKEKYGELIGCMPAEQTKKTCLERYGTEHFFASEAGRMSFENLKNSYGWTDEDLANFARGRNTSGAYGFGKASRESLKIFVPLYKFLRKNGIERSDIQFGVTGSLEYVIYDPENFKKYLFDFVILSKKVIIEYNGRAFHPRLLHEDGWLHPFTREPSENYYERDRAKVSYAISQGFKVLELWSDEENNLEKAKQFIKECYEKPGD